MSNREIVQGILANILVAMSRIERRFDGIKSPDDFVGGNEGLDRLDGITMMLIAIGEQLKQLDKVWDGDLAVLYPDVDWRGAKGIRDFLSHHYFSIDAEIIFDVCQNKLSGLKQAIVNIQDNF